ncbi:MAG: calcium/sodium antiporter [Pseudohongiella sp.]|uniref:calcium/sodium antiporter n=1 Tax=Pseudohongiella sp. TaxID=1979412 RepID=UPI0034A0425E
MLLDVFIICLGFAGLIWGADKFVFGASAFARNLGISPLVIGLTIVAFGTSAPEIFSSAASALAGEPELAIGNAVGSNIFNLGVALGVAVVIKPITPPKSLSRKEIPALLLVSAVCGLLLANLYLGVLDSVILIGIIAYFIYYLFSRKAAGLEEDDTELPDQMSTLRAGGYLLLGLALLIIGAEALVGGAISIAGTLGVSSGIIGLTLVALGTSLPELAATVTCALRGHHELAIGNIIGSNIMNILVVLPFPGLLAAGSFHSDLFYRDYTAMMIMTLLLAAICYLAIRRGKQIGRLSGIAFLLLYAGWFGIMYYQIH